MRLLLALLALLAFVLSPVRAQDDRARAIEEAAAELAAIRENVARDAIEDADEVAARLRALRDASRARLDPVLRDIARLESDLSALGPAPAEGEPPEAPALREEREALNRELAALRAQEVRINANIVQATELLAQISARRIGALYGRVLERERPLLSLGLWGDAFAGARASADRIGAFFKDWGARKTEREGLAPALFVILVAVAVSVLMFGPVKRWVADSFSSRVERFEPTPARRIIVAGLNMLATAGPGIVGGLIVLETLRAQGLVAAAGSEVARQTWFALVALLLVNGFVSGLLRARRPEWRIAPVLEDRGRKAASYVVAIVAIFGVKSVLKEIALATGAGGALERVLDGTSAAAIGALLFLLSRGSLWRAAAPVSDPDTAAVASRADAPESRAPRDSWRPVRRTTRLVAVVAAAAPFAGYIAFADFVTSRFYYLALMLSVAWFARALLREAAVWAFGRMQTKDARAGADEKDRSGFDVFWAGAAIDVVFLLAIVPFALILAGLPASSVRDVVWQAFFGFQIGGVRIPSVAKILLAVALFLAVLGLTRLLQRGLARGPFRHSGLDVGVQESLITLLGYAGFISAMLIGVTALGFDLANLAIIAGALSVGIGFGLQSIVNNFVSGLILLFERPIKAGDWIITASGEGTVKKISVRSTEIETFDRSSIIIPNSELISQSVTNWTHKNKIGRVTVPVGVSYSSDPEVVRDILLNCAREHPQVLRYPEPFVVWKDFGASSLDFEIRAYIRDISLGLSVRTDLRFAIFRALKEAGVEIPFPQRDLHIKTMPAAAPFGASAPAQKPDGAAVGSSTPKGEPELEEDD